MAYNPKSYRKFVAASASAALVASAVAPAAVSADTDGFSDVDDSTRHADAINALLEMEVTTGFPGGEFRPDQTIKRGEAAIMLQNALGLEDGDVDAVPFEDLAESSAAAVAALYEADITDGKSETEFGTDDEVTREEMAALIVRAYELDTDVEDQDLPDAEDTVLSAEVNALVAHGYADGYPDGSFGVGDDINRGDFAAFLYKTHTGEEEEEEEVEEVAVESVSADNLKQIKIDLSGDVDLEEAVEEDNYTVENSNGTELDFSVQVDEGSSTAADDTRVTLTLDSDMDNQDVVTVTVDEAVAGEEVVEEVEFFDTTVPEANSAEVVGSHTVKVNFSEPIDFGELDEDTGEVEDGDIEDAFELNDGSTFVRSVTPLNGGTSANVEFYSELEEGENTITVSNDLEDYAGYNLVSTELDFDVEVDEEAPELVNVKNATPYKATLVFDEDIELTGTENNAISEEHFYHTNSNNPAKSVEVSGNEIEVSFDEDKALPNGTAYLYVQGEAVQDLWGNENTQQLTASVEVESDNDAPELSEVESTGQSTVEVTFNEEVSDSAEEESNYTLLDEDGDEVEDAVTSAVLNDDSDGVTLTLDSPVYGNHTLVVEDVEDVYGNAMSSAEYDFFVEDSTRPKHDEFDITLYDAEEDVQTLYVDFDQEMSVSGSYSVEDLDKYQYGGNDLSSLSGVSVNAVDGNSGVEIKNEVDESGVEFAADEDLTVGRVADAAGNTTVNYSDDINIDAADNVELDGDVRATDVDTIEMTFDDILASFDEDDFEIENTDGKVELAGVDRVDEDGQTTITFTLAEGYELDHSAEDGDGNQLSVSTINSDDVESQNAYGEKVLVDDETVVDAINPELVEDGVTQEDNETIQLEFEEEVEFSNASTAATDLVLTNEDGEELVPDVDYTLDGDAEGTPSTTIDVTLVSPYDGDIDVETASTVRYINDGATDSEDSAAPNFISAFDEELAFDLTGPAVTNVEEGEDASEVVISFNEELDETEAETSGNYSFSGGFVSSASYDSDDNSVTLSLDTDASDEDTVEVTTSVTDVYGNELDEAVTYEVDSEGNWTVVVSDEE
ncbi:S-layer homology domain-containing protein [Alkalibacillus aidingensis]|uniref:S-layer homology domain-containing protein n=1 Tax=Alkalibacillus aidingensis TaxID=2747607 RepID=UPI0016601D70|nr:S-layer homology domain-containing protein [Alkalibacillus aidingensis]